MKLGYKTRVLLDMILVFGVDALEFLTYPTKSLFRAGGWDTKRNMTRHFKTMRDKGCSDHLRCKMDCPLIDSA